MRRETGEALLASSPQLRPCGPTLSSLVERITQSRSTSGRDTPASAPQPGSAPESAVCLLGRRVPAPTLGLPSGGLFSAASAGRSRHTYGAGTGGERGHPVDGTAGGVALLGAHGGAGVTSLLRAGLERVAVDADRSWPAAGLVLLVARTSTRGLECARDLARQHGSGLADDVELLGLVLVADAPGRLPTRLRGLQELVSGAFPRIWSVPWLAEWRLAATTEPLPAHPDVRQLTAELTHTIQLAPLQPPPLQLSHPTPNPARTPGVLL
jgi:hypothetical protein